VTKIQHEFNIEQIAVLFVVKADLKSNQMIKQLTRIDIIMLALAFISLIVSEIMWFSGEHQAALFIGMWVPSILGFAIYLKLLKSNKNG
jgi:hypothetical protein